MTSNALTADRNSGLNVSLEVEGQSLRKARSRLTLPGPTASALFSLTLKWPPDGSLHNFNRNGDACEATFLPSADSLQISSAVNSSSLNLSNSPAFTVPTLYAARSSVSPNYRNARETAF